MSSKIAMIFSLIFVLMLTQAAQAQENLTENSESSEETIGEVITLPCGAHYIVGNPEDVESNSGSSTRTKSRGSAVDNQ